MLDHGPRTVALGAAFVLVLLAGPSFAASLSTTEWKRAENVNLRLDDSPRSVWATQSSGLARDFVTRAMIVTAAAKRRSDGDAERGSAYIADIADLTPETPAVYDSVLDDRRADYEEAMEPDSRGQHSVPTVPEPTAALAFGLGALILGAWKMRWLGPKRS